MVVALQTKRSTRSPLLSLRKSFLKGYDIENKNLSDTDLSALLLYFALDFLKHNKSLAYVFDALKNFLPDPINLAMPLPNNAAIADAKSFYLSVVDESFFQNIANLGFAYQIFNSGIRKREALATAQSANKKLSTRQLIAFTQLYTPDWVVDYLVANTIGPSLTKKPNQIPDRFARWLMPESIADNTDIDPTSFSLLDPACGSGNFLFAAFDLLSSICENPLAHIFGADIDEKGLWVTGLGLLCQHIIKFGDIPNKQANLFCANKNDEAGFIGSIDRNWPKPHLLNQKYQVIVTNPPYLGRRCMSRELKSTLQKQYPESSSDLCAAFFQRCCEMLKPTGRLGLITQASLLSIPSYQKLRDHLFNTYQFETIVRCGPGVFPLATGEKIDSILVIAKAPKSNNETTRTNTALYDISALKDKATKLQAIATNLKNGKTHIKLSDLSSGLAFGMPPQLIDKLATFPKLSDIADIKQGLATTNNSRFVRYHFDVDARLIGSQWIPYIKGAGSEKFASENPFVVKWGNNGQEIKEAVAKAYPYLNGKTAWVVKNEEFYFRPGLCFSFINKSGLAVRRLPAGSIFDVGSSAIFAKPEDEDFLLAYLNSSLLGLIAKAINQTINVQVGDLKKLPILPLTLEQKNKLGKLGQQCFIVKQKLLELEQIDLGILRKKQQLISASQLESLLVDHESKHKEFFQQSIDMQLETDRLILENAKRLDIFSNEDSIYLSNILKTGNGSCIFDSTLFNYKLLSALIASLLCIDKGTERIAYMPDDQPLARVLGLSECGGQWLERRLDQSLSHACFRTANRNKLKAVDISKLARQPSRYFGLTLDNRHLFFSANAVRHQLKSPKTNDYMNQFPIFKQLQNIEDWTSKDLLNVIN